MVEAEQEEGREEVEVREEGACGGGDGTPLFYALVCGEVRGVVHLHHDGLLGELARQPLHLPRPGGREHERLPLGPEQIGDPSQLRLEAQVEHPVSLVADQQAGAPQVGLPSLQEVEQPPRCGDHQLDPPLQVSQLRTLGHASVHASVRHTRPRSVCVALGLDLQRKLARRSEHQRDGALSCGEERLGEDVDE